ncbi:hypothetical protein [Actinocorallia populi]|uniref:hypothetical protein n=1 Tax=Actinocorallia populi TaxID=2079200 RepID=UPI000D0972B0|nr:hypothetical protein [Actinocorallia populi]
MVTLTSTDCLRELADRLTDRGLRVRIDQPIGRPRALYVSNPGVPGSTESVFLKDQALWWSWGDLLAAASNLDTAVAGICRVLGVHAPSLN